MTRTFNDMEIRFRPGFVKAVCILCRAGHIIAAMDNGAWDVPDIINIVEQLFRFQPAFIDEVMGFEPSEGNSKPRLYVSTGHPVLSARDPVAVRQAYVQAQIDGHAAPVSLAEQFFAAKG